MANYMQVLMAGVYGGLNFIRLAQTASIYLFQTLIVLTPPENKYTPLLTSLPVIEYIMEVWEQI